jgi:hypothetical protein
MAGGTKTVNVAPNSELARLLRTSGDESLDLLFEGRRFRVELEDSSQGDQTDEELWADFDPARFLEGIEAGAGAWSDLDAEQMKANIRRWRDEGSGLSFCS